MGVFCQDDVTANFAAKDEEASSSIELLKASVGMFATEVESWSLEEEEEGAKETVRDSEREREREREREKSNQPTKESTSSLRHFSPLLLQLF
jgi:hypothetical protein